MTSTPEKLDVEKANNVFAVLRDSPTIEDLLGFKQFAISIAKNIIRDTDGDFDNNAQMTIGVYGEWGNGKTSFLQMVEQELKESRIYPIWFDAWKYEKEDNLWAALVQKILDEAKVSGNWSRRAWVQFLIWKDSIRLRDGLWEVLKKVSPIFFKLLLIIISLYISIGLDTKTIEAFLSHWFPNNSVITTNVQANIIKTIGLLTAVFVTATGPFNLINIYKGKLGIDFSKFRHRSSYREHIAFLDEFGKEFEKIVRLLGQGKPLVIIIDDLDRCLPEKAIQVIEAIKLFLDIKGCIFLLALDRSIVERSVAVKYKEMMSIEGDINRSFDKKTRFYEDYMDKFIQLAIVLPRLRRVEIQEFVRNLSTDEDVTQCATIFGVGLSPNPRKIKRILRAFLFVRDMLVEDIRKYKIRTSIIAKLIVIQNQLTKVFEAFIEDPLLLEKLEKYYRMKDGNQEQLNPTVKVEEEEKPFIDKAEKYAVDYPELPKLLLTQIDEDDTFINVDINRYISLIGVLAVVRPTPAVPGTKLPKEEVLKNAYKQIQAGMITSPDVIRSMAANFRAIANDPEASQNVSFDAAQAARTLYDRAKLIEEQENQVFSQSGWSYRAPSDDNLSGVKAPHADVPMQSGWSYRAPSDDNLSGE
jgi:KAP family P-loop domain